MTGAEQAVRAKALTVLGADDALAELVHGVFDGVPPRASAPYVSVGAAEGRDWGTKDRPGCEVRLTLSLTGAGLPADAGGAAARMEAAARALRGPAGGWTVVAVRALRSRLASRREGGWRHDLVVRCRCLAGVREGEA